MPPSRRPARPQRPRGRPAARRARPRSGRRDGGTQARRMRLAREPLPWHVSTPYLQEASAPPDVKAWPTARPLSSRSRRRSCSRPMPAASFPWRRAPRIRRSIGSSPRSAAGSRSTRLTLPSRLARTVRSDRFTVTVNRDFDAVLEGCAEPRPGRPRTWINARIRVLYRKLHDRRHCHSLEVYDGETLVGGLYGVTLGRAFFGESMFHRARDASKVALVHLIARLKAGGFKLLDTQFVTDHLRTFGAIEVPQRQYHKLLEAALTGEGDFAALGTKGPVSGAQVLALLTADRSSRV